MKTCTKCGVEKPLSAFNLEKRNKDGRRGDCKACEYVVHKRWYHENKVQEAAKTRAWERSHPEAIFDRHLRKHYGITREEYMVLLEIQGGVCAICRQPEKVKNYRTGKVKMLSVDHDHLTGQVRGLLCQYCNQAIGFFEEDAERMVSAMEYLEKAVKQRKVKQLELFPEPHTHEQAAAMMDEVFKRRA